LIPPTRYSPILAPNGLVVSGSMPASQAGIDVLENGGTAIDATVAALAAGVVVAESPPNGKWALSGMIVDGFEARPELFSWMGTDLSEVLAAWHSALTRLGSRSLYDLVRPALVLARNCEPAAPWLDALRGAEHCQTTASLTWSECPPVTALGVELHSPSGVMCRTVTPLPEPSSTQIAGDREAVELLDLICELEHSAPPGERSVIDVCAIDHRCTIASMTLAQDLATVEQSHIMWRRADVLTVATAERGGTQALAQVCAGTVDSGNTAVGHVLQSAVEASRVNLKITRGKTSALVEVGTHSTIVNEISRRGWPRAFLPRWDARFGAVQTVSIDLSCGMLIGAADPRGRGQAAGY
jgi:hypothetical protein